MGTCSSRHADSWFSWPHEELQEIDEENPEVGEGDENLQPTGIENENMVYFGTHFSLGGQRFLTADSENFLFEGLRTEDFPERRAISRIFRPPRVHESTTVRSCINLNRDTIRLVPLLNSENPVFDEGDIKKVEEEEEEGEEPLSPLHEPTIKADDEEEIDLPNKSDQRYYQIKFKFDSLEDCSIRFYFLAREIADDNTKPRYESKLGADGEVLMNFEKGLGQTCLLDADHPLDIQICDKEEWVHSQESEQYPVIITVEPNEVQESTVSMQTTFATLLPCSDGSYEIKPLLVKIWHQNTLYLVHDIYGSDQSSESDFGRECVICITNPRDTTVLPCRHMCLCSECAEVFRYQTDKCPICRGSVKSLLKINIMKGKPEVSLDEEEEEQAEQDD